MMLTTGMSMLGKISVGVRTIANIPMIRMSMAITTNVYGRRNASRTIHIEFFPKSIARDHQAVVITSLASAVLKLLTNARVKSVVWEAMAIAISCHLRVCARCYFLAVTSIGVQVDAERPTSRLSFARARDTWAFTVTSA